MEKRNKSIYSLLLMDEVVAAVDQAAHRAGTSRSNFINQVLAEYLSFTTPEMEMKGIFDRLLDLVGGSDIFQVQNHPSDAMLSLRSSLRYRYNPTIRYSVELLRGAGPFAGELRVSCRSQNQALLSLIGVFADFWGKLEEAHVAKFFPQNHIPFAVEEGRFSRRFLAPPDCGPQELGAALSDYIHCLDSCMKYYFDHLDSPKSPGADIQRIYQSYLKKTNHVL